MVVGIASAVSKLMKQNIGFYDVLVFANHLAYCKSHQVVCACWEPHIFVFFAESKKRLVIGWGTEVLQSWSAQVVIPLFRWCRRVAWGRHLVMLRVPVDSKNHCGTTVWLDPQSWCWMKSDYNLVRFCSEECLFMCVCGSRNRWTEALYVVVVSNHIYPFFEWWFSNDNVFKQPTSTSSDKMIIRCQFSQMKVPILTD